MKALEAIGEDFRRLGVAAIVTGLVGGFLEGSVPAVAAVIAGALGITLNVIGYWVHRRAEKQQ